MAGAKKRPVLETINLTKKFGGVVPTNHLNLEIQQGEVLCIIGPNGAGKSTLFNQITGFLKPTSGDIYFDGKKIDHLRPHKICRMGVGRKFQHPSVFNAVTVLDNLMIAACGKRHFSDALRKDRETDRERVRDILKITNLEGKEDVPADRLSHGQKQWLEVGMVLVNEPKLLLLDEPTAGMTKEETAATVQLIENIVRDDLTVVVIEHDINFIRDIATKAKGVVTVLNQGSFLMSGTLEEVSSDCRVRECYLGNRKL